jgi:hypothetical protein
MYLFESKSNRARCHPERSEGSCFFVQLEDPSSRAPQMTAHGAYSIRMYSPIHLSFVFCQTKNLASPLPKSLASLTFHILLFKGI